MAEISVIIAAHNAGLHIAECLDSIFSQTFIDFECIVVNDGSTDSTLEILGRFSDKRLKVINLAQNCGIAIARNLASRYARGKYIAVMDADDVALPSRLAAQVAFLDANPAVDILGSRTFRVANTIANVIDSPKHPLDDSTIKARLILLNGSALIHPTTMMRRSFIEKNWLYYPTRKMDVDHAFWIDALALGAKFACLEEPLLYKRGHDRNISRTEIGRKEPAKTPLRQKLLGLLQPDLTLHQTAALARVMQRPVHVRREEITTALEAARVVQHGVQSQFGENRLIFNLIIKRYAALAAKLIEA